MLSLFIFTTADIHCDAVVLLTPIPASGWCMKESRA